MQTSLAKQLKQLELPTTSGANANDLRGSTASFLFDRKTQLDRETIFAIGINGLEELESLQPEFARFRETLFDDSSIRLERSVESRETNVKLDAEVTVFLRLLSPFLLLKPAHKALEWLVHRFSIHLYNGNQLIDCALPYHDTVVFVRVVQLLDVDKFPRWRFLLQCQKTGSPLSKLALFNRCQSDLDFMRHICRIVEDAVSVEALRTKGQLRTLVLFYLSAVLGVLERENVVSEPLLTTLLPYFVTGVQSGVAEYVGASYVALAQLALKVHAIGNVWMPLLEAIFHKMPKSLASEAVSCASIICQMQALTRLPPKCRKRLVGLRMRSAVAELSERADVSPLTKLLVRHEVLTALKGVVGGACKKKKKSSEKQAHVKKTKAAVNENFTWLIQNVRMTDEHVSHSVRILLMTYVRLTKKGFALDQRVAITMLELLEKRYAGDFDDLLGGECNAHFANEKSKKVAALLVQAFQKNPKVASKSANRFLALNHPNAARRTLAVQQLAKEKVLNAETFASYIVDRLADDDPGVVGAVLHSKRLIGHLPAERLADSLMSIVNKCRTLETWKDLRQELIAGALAKLDDEAQLSTETQSRIVACLLPILFDRRLSVVSSQLLLKGTVPLLKATLKHLQECVSDCEDQLPNMIVMLAAVSLALVHAHSPPLKKHLMQLLLSEASKSRDQKNYDGMDSFFARSILPLLFCEWVMAETDVALRIEFSQCVLCFIADGLKKKAFRKFIAQLPGSCAADILQVDHFFGEQVSLVEREAGVLLVALSRLMTITKLPADTREMQWFDVRANPLGDFSSLLRANVTIFRIFTDIGGSEVSRLLLRQWSSTIFADDEKGLLKYLLFLATTSPDDFQESSVATQLRSLLIIRSLVVARTSMHGGTGNLMVAAILAACASSTKVVRSTAVDTLSELARNVAPDDVFVGLLGALEAQRAEIQEDASLLHVVLAAYFKSNVAGAQKDLAAFVSRTIENGTPDHIQDKLLFCLTGVDDPHLLVDLVPTLDVILKSRDRCWRTATRHSVAQRIIGHFTPHSAAAAFKLSPLAFRVFIEALRHADLPPLVDSSPHSLQMTALSQLSKTMFVTIDSGELQQEIVRNLVDLQVDNDDYEATRKMAKVLRKTMSINGLLVRRELERSVQPVRVARLLKEAKRSGRTTNFTENKNDALSDDFSHKRTVIILEALHGKLANAAGHDNRVVSVLFAHLKRYVERQDQATSEYGKQLVLSALNDSLQWTNDGDGDASSLGQDQFNVELVIECIRTSSSPKTHQEALLLLALAAKRFPEHVVHNTMAIFTFMGENVVRKDDSSSFDVILKTVGAIVPAVVQQVDQLSTQKNDDDEDVNEGTALRTAFALTRVFVDAAPDIPEHRRLPLFSCLVSGMGELRYLWLTVALVLERIVTYKRIVSGPEKSVFSRLGVLEFCVQLSERYSPSCQIASCESLVDCLIQLPDVEERDERRNEKRYVGNILDLERHSPRLRSQFKLMVAEFVSTLLSSRQFLDQVVDLRADEQEQMMLQYQSLLKKVLTAAHAVARRLATLKPDAHSALIKYFKVLQHRVYELLDKLSSLLPSNLFVDVIDQLMRDGQLLVRHKALEILAAKLQHRGDNLDKPNRASLKRVVPTLLLIVQSTDEENEKEDEDERKEESERMMESKEAGTGASNRQLALLTLKYLCRQLGAEEPHLFRNCLEEATNVVRDQNVDDNVRASALLYVAEHCHSVRSDAIAHLSAFVPALLSVLDRHHLDAIQKHELLLLSVISALHKVVERLAPFLSPYIGDLLQKVCRLSILEPDNPNSPLVDRLTTIRFNLAVSVPPRVLVPAIKLCFKAFGKSGDEKAIGPLMATLREYVANADKEQLTLWHPTLFAFYLIALDFRSEHSGDDNNDGRAIVSEVEGCIIEAMLATILKMSEATFRPFFIKLFDWAVRGDGPTDRVITFYRIADQVADQLKSLFVLFAGHLIKNAAVMLDRCNLSKIENPFFVGIGAHIKGGVLVRYILGCLHKCFLYDNEGFMTKERFETLLQPVVDQLENVDCGATDTDGYEALVVDCVAPCIARMAVANEAYWKPLNYQVLLKTRHQLPKVRFGALQVLREVTKSIGEDYVTLLPETIPFLAELMEDEKLEVEEQCQAVIADMEVVLGEPLQKYF